MLRQENAVGEQAGRDKAAGAMTANAPSTK